MNTTDSKGLALGRREFIHVSAAGAAAALSPALLTTEARAQTPKDDLRVALVGCGLQGRTLIEAATPIKGIRFTAVCDIWEYSRRYAQGMLKKAGHDPKPFVDFEEMLGEMKDVDAVIVATPDFWHAPHTNAALKAGHHVYCEKMMSNTVEGARSMVQTMRETGKLLQIGHQRRSNPRYIFARQKIIGGGVLGRITNAYGQWNRAVTEPFGWPSKYPIAEDVLKKYGYSDMTSYRNWRWYKRYGGGPLSDLGAHQIEIFGWFLGSKPVSIMASGGRDYYTDYEWWDNVMAIYEYATPAGRVRAFYQVLTTTSSGGGYFETFMGVDGTLKLSENPRLTQIYREARAPDWTPYVDSGVLKMGAAPAAPADDAVVDARETKAMESYTLGVEMDKRLHQPHLENFFDAIRGQTKLNCPGDEALASELAVFKTAEAVVAEKKLVLTPDDYKV